MMLRNVTAARLLPLVGAKGFETRFELDCGHSTRRNGDMLHLKRVLCGTCSAHVGELTQRAMSGR